MMMSSSRKIVLAGSLFALLCLMPACGKKDPFERTELSGKVTLNGVPVSSGEVILTPDSDKGNSGPAVVAPIARGTYQSVSGSGPVSGPASVRIFGYGDQKSSDGVPALVIDGYEATIEIPKGRGVIDFELKKEDLKKK